MAERKKRSNAPVVPLVTLVAIMIGVIFGTSLSVAAFQEREKKTVRLVKRVKRPKFDRKQWQLTYFDNLFEQGLVGPRPDAGQLAANNPTSTKIPNSAEETPVAGEGKFAWSTFVPREVIEDEIKTLQQRLNVEVTTPSKFKTGYAQARQTFSMLSMCFGIVREFDEDIRWKKDAPKAQVDFQTAAANARVGTPQAYQSCKRRRDLLVEMVRGGSLASDAKVPDELEWSEVIDRTPIMIRLTKSSDKLKALVANKLEFTSNIEQVLHEASLVAAMGQVLAREDMTDADDEDYAGLAVAMQTAASNVVEACKNNDYDAASKAGNVILQSCDNCHEDWK